ncbi:MAG: chitobiase/beta-hexosaminidase C-terminal domain-containing protein [Acidobacteria bacterium]|nr:chitobiase/beta-hexosaminidase C-terminal domain-containing protein [Acidobacteriota bacterium]
MSGRRWRLAGVWSILLASAAMEGGARIVPAPAFDHVSGRYANVLWLSASATAGATIRATTDGTIPTAASAVFDVPILIARSTTVRARAFAGSRPVSGLATGHFVIDLPRRGAPALHVVPTTFQNDPSGFLEACLQGDEWPDVRNRTLYFGSTIGIAALGDDELTACFRAMRRQRLQLTVEAGVINDGVTDAAALFAKDAPQFRRLIRLGAPLSVVFLQEPWTSTSESPLTYAEVVAETAEWMSLAQRAFPGLRLILQEAYPYRSADALISFIGDVNAAAVTSGARPLDGFELDHDWNIPAWTPADIVRLGEATRGRGMTFSIILWPAGPPTGDDCAFGRRIARQLRDLYGPAAVPPGQAIAPDMWSIESWSEIPAAILPETGRCTFMAGARDVVAALTE